MKKNIICNYYMEKILGILEKKKIVRFNGFLEYKILDISPKTLSKCLQMLVKEGKIKRRSFAECPPRVEYSLK